MMAPPGRATSQIKMADSKLDVVGCGSMVVDLFYRTPRIIRADEKVILDAGGHSVAIEQASVGGVVLNHLGWARVLGLETGIFGKMADDRNGEFLRDGMESLGIRHHLTLDGSASSYATVFVDPAGNRAIYMMRGATAELKASEIRARHGVFIKNARMVSTEISQLPLKTVIAILKLAREHSIPTVLDLDVPPSDAIDTLGTRAELDQALKLATYLKPAKGAARELADGNDPLKIAEQIRARYGNEAVIMTDGPNGCAISAKDTSVRVPAFKVKVVDTTGAGDAFLGGVLAGLLWKLKWPEIGRLANSSAAIGIGRLGAFPSGFELRGQILRLYGRPLPITRNPKVKTSALRTTTAFDPQTEIQRFFDVAIEELSSLRREVNLGAIEKAVEMIRVALTKGGRVHLTGVGKPEHVARYGASLLCSVGTPATFLHATETLHGSLGQIHPRDVVIAISNSGNTSELCQAAMAIRDHGAQLIAITGNPQSELAHLANLILHTPIKREGGILGLAPRISVLGQIFVLAGLSVALEAARGLTIEEYSRWHRAGALGEAARRLSHRSGNGKLKAL
jgi:sugar/nucleoside kinase (ribokinase family)/D-arabinose 5-phosphate isomerase GutQ